MTLAPHQRVILPANRTRAFQILAVCAVVLSVAGYLCLSRRGQVKSAAHFRVIAGDRIRAVQQAIARHSGMTGALAQVIERDGGLTADVQTLLDSASPRDVRVLWVAWNGTGTPRIQRFGATAPDRPVWLNDGLGRAARTGGLITLPAAAPDGAELLAFARRVPDTGPLLGVVVVAARVSDIVEHTVEGMEPAAVELTLEDETLGGRNVYANRPRGEKSEAGFTETFPLRFADRSWTVRAASAPDSAVTPWGWAGGLAVGAGLLSALLAAALARTIHREREKDFALAQESMSMGVWEWDIVHGRATASPMLFRLFGLHPGSRFPLREEWMQLVHPDDRERMQQSLAAALEDGPRYEHEYRVISPGGKTRWLLSKGHLFRDESGRAVRLLGVNLDVTAAKEAELALNATQERMRRMFANAEVGVLRTDVEGRIVEVNDFACRATGYSRDEMLTIQMGGLVHHDDLGRHLGRFRALVEGEIADYVTELRMLRKNGTVLWIRISASSTMEDGRCSGIVALCEDITARRTAEEKLEYQWLNDPLTGLPNRRLFDDRTQQAVSDARRTGGKLAVICLEIDGFHAVKDSLDAAAADSLLAAAAARLRGSLRANDTLARLGGAQFGILAAHSADAGDAEQVGRKLIDAMAEPFHAGEQEVVLIASVGISLYPRHGSDAGELIRDAQAALHSAKREGRNRLSFFTPELGRALRERVELEGQLHGVIERAEIVVHYQPEYDLRSGQLVGFEALARWKHSDLGLVPPARFIPLAEENGMIVPIGMAVLEQACREGLRWQRPGGPPVQVAVNVSSIQFFREDFVERVMDVLHRTGLPPHLLQLELTESVLVTGFAGPAAKMAQLREQGIGLMVDDFGTGYSSLSYLPRLPFQGMKIDRSFVRNLHEMAESRAMIQSLVSLAHNLNLSVVVEGVESPEELAAVRALGCDTVQGYLLGRPSASTARHLEGDRRLLLPSESLTYS